jgi:hypothetical protein
LTKKILKRGEGATVVGDAFATVVSTLDVRARIAAGMSAGPRVTSTCPFGLLRRGRWLFLIS